MPDTNIASLGLFQGPEHQPFLWEAGQPAVLLLHGFMGTPAELRPLGEAFRQADWTVQGLLLPGFGSEIGTLFERHHQEWSRAATAALQDIQRRHSPVVLLGYSMGAAVGLNVAAEHPPDGLILAAPFWRIGTPIQRIIWQFVKRLFRRPQPFKRADFTDPRLRDFFGGLLPELDLSDPETQQTLRQLRVPTAFADQIIDVGRGAGEAAAKVTVPTLIVQGIDDQAVRAEVTRRLLQAFPGAIQYRELAADHELVRPENPGFAGLSSATLAFATDLASQHELTSIGGFSDRSTTAGDQHLGHVQQAL